MRVQIPNVFKQNPILPDIGIAVILWGCVAGIWLLVKFL